MIHLQDLLDANQMSALINTCLRMVFAALNILVTVVLYTWYKKEREARDKCTAEVEGTIRFVNRYTKTYQWSGESNIERTAVLYRPMFGYQYNGETYAEFPAFDSGIDDEKYYVVGNRYKLWIDPENPKIIGKFEMNGGKKNDR